MTDLGEIEPNEGCNNKPPKRHWEATRKERFLDLKFSHYVEILLTLALVGIAYLQYTVYNRQAGIMDEQTKISKQQLELSQIGQRPWISVDLRPDGPLIHDADGWHLVLKYDLKNVGSLPAFGADFLATMFPWSQDYWPPETIIKDGIPQGKPIAGDDIQTKAEAICKAQEDWRSFGWGRVMFPLDIRNERFRVNAPAVVSGGYTGNFIVVGCASYRFSGDSMTHSTVKIYEAFKLTGSKKIEIDGETIPTSDLGFVIHPAHGSYAN